MIAFTMPGWVKEILAKPLDWSQYQMHEANLLKEKFKKFQVHEPLVSVVLPAWNEEKGILHTLWSLAMSDLRYPTELIVVDNNSTDGTAALLKQLGIKTISETKQGVGHARTRGLQEAKGKYVLTGDSDTLYPPQWINLMTKALLDGEKTPVYCVHSSYSFIPQKISLRWQYALYEILGSYTIRKKEKTQPFLNVYGFYTGLVAAKGRELNGYEVEVQRTFQGTVGELETNATEDGMMALRLMNAGGKIQAVRDPRARVWTSDRRIQLDGGLASALKIRIKKYLNRI